MIQVNRGWRCTIGLVLSRSRRKFESGPPSSRMSESVQRLRTPAALAAGLVLAHDAVFASDSGLASLNTALTRSGHGELWAIVSLVALVAGAFVVVGAIARLLRAESAVHRLQLVVERGAGSGRHHVVDAAPPAQLSSGYSGELRRLWPRLFAAVLVGFLIQENVEALAGQSTGAGLEPILAGHPLAVPVMLLLTFGIAAVGALVRRRIAVLAVRESALRSQRPAHRNGPSRLTTRRPSDGGVLLRDALRRLPQEGRAPPRAAVRITA